MPFVPVKMGPASRCRRSVFALLLPTGEGADASHTHCNPPGRSQLTPYVLAVMPQDLAGIDDRSADRAHLFDCLLGIIRPEIDSAASVFDNMGSKSERSAVKHRKFHAIIGGQTADKNLIHFAFAQVIT